MSHDHGHACECSKNHQPAPLELHIHHIWPLADGGPDDPANEEYICPSTHVNTHELYRAMKKAGREIPMREFSSTYTAPVSRHAYKLAAQGFRRYSAKAMVD